MDRLLCTVCLLCQVNVEEGNQSVFICRAVQGIIAACCSVFISTQVKPKPLLLKLLKLAGAEKDTFTMKEVRTFN